MLSLLAFTALSAVQSSTETHIHSAILVIDTSNNASYNQVNWLVDTPYLAIKASNVNGMVGSTLMRICINCRSSWSLLIFLSDLTKQLNSTTCLVVVFRFHHSLLFYSIGCCFNFNEQRRGTVC